MTQVTTTPQRTALYDCHLESKAKMVDFAGWEMPIEYSGIKKEHEAVRTSAGLFDLSHMGECFVSGEGALEWLQSLFTNALPKTRSGKIMRRLLRDIAAGKETSGDTTTLEDFTVLAKLRHNDE